MDARIVATVLAVGLLAGTIPNAAAAETRVPLGVSAASVDEVKAAGATPAFASYWVGEWMASSGWGGLERMLDKARANGITPVLYWYYWGDSISPSCVDHGCNSRTRAEWNALTTTLASKIGTHMQGATTYVVLENEFNKGGVTGSYAPTFDALLEAKAKELKAVAGVKVILGYGAWGENDWDNFPRSIAASDMIGFQMMRASTQDTESEYRNAPQRMAAMVARAREIAPTKDSFLYDLALSSYSGSYWARVQDEVMAAVIAKGNELVDDGLRGIVYREIRDNPGMSLANYYGIAEQYWGLKDRYGNAKPGWTTWLNAAKGQSVAPPPPPDPAAFTATFTPKTGNEWWVETKVSADQAVSKVCARVNGGTCQPLALKSWGAWAASFRVPAGATVTFTATSTSGGTATSAGYLWWGTAPVVVPTPTPSTMTATFTPHDGNAWWIQTKVTASETVKAVCASVNGGACQPLTLKSWGSWAASYHAPAGAKVVFRATGTSGATVSSQAYTWPVG